MIGPKKPLSGPDVVARVEIGPHGAPGREDALTPLPRAVNPFVPRRRLAAKPPPGADGAETVAHRPAPRPAGVMPAISAPRGSRPGARLHAFDDGVTCAQNAQLKALCRRAAAVLGSATALPACRPGDALVDEFGDVGRYTPTAACVMREVPVAELSGQRRDTSLDSLRIASLLRGLVEGKKLPPVRVDASGRLLNGFHRLYVAKLLGLSTLTAEVMHG